MRSGRPLVHADLTALASLGRVVAADSYELDGRRHRLSGGDLSPRMLIDALSDRLYRRYYVRLPIASEGPSSAAERQAHIGRLSAANAGHGTWDSDWEIVRRDADGRIVVRTGVLELWASERWVRVERGEIVPGRACRLRVGKEMQDFQAGYYLAIGDAEEQTQAGGGFLRLYWHVRLAGSVALMRALTGTLNRAAIPFRFKMLSRPSAYRRPDSGVLYVHGRHYRRLEPLVGEIHSAVRTWLEPRTPLMTLRLADGLGLAEDAPDGQSFGEHRCRLVARALLQAFESGVDSPESRASAIADSFRDVGLDPLAPHLAERSAMEYRPLPEPRRTVSNPAEERSAAAEKSWQPLERALAIGRKICRAAHWHEGRCGWLAPGWTSAPDSPGRLERVVTALGGSLYSGTSGVALFLAELHSRAPEELLEKTALAALEQAFEGVAREPSRLAPLSFYTGSLGIAWVGRRVARLTGSASWAARSEELYTHCLAAIGDRHKLDLLSGAAGAILALLARFRSTGDPRSLDAAVRLGDEIVSAATRDAGGCRWENARVMGSNAGAQPLTGLSHGAAGLGLALLELQRTSDRPALLETARAAFAYEDELFDARHGGWPDFRVDAPPGSRYPIAWCHGAAGIALSRLRALTLGETGDACQVSARAGLEATLGRLERLATGRASEGCLCHGWSGLVEVALVAARTRGEPAYRELAERVCRNQLAQAAEPRSAVLDPSLMLGRAGVGYSLLRLLDEPPPSVLLVGSSLDASQLRA